MPFLDTVAAHCVCALEVYLYIFWRPNVYVHTHMQQQHHNKENFSSSRFLLSRQQGACFEHWHSCDSSERWRTNKQSNELKTQVCMFNCERHAQPDEINKLMRQNHVKVIIFLYAAKSFRSINNWDFSIVTFIHLPNFVKNSITFKFSIHFYLFTLKH